MLPHFSLPRPWPFSLWLLRLRLSLGPRVAPSLRLPRLLPLCPSALSLRLRPVLLPLLLLGSRPWCCPLLLSRLPSPPLPSRSWLRRLQGCATTLISPCSKLLLSLLTFIPRLLTLLPLLAHWRLRLATPPRRCPPRRLPRVLFLPLHPRSQVPRVFSLSWPTHLLPGLSAPTPAPNALLMMLLTIRHPTLFRISPLSTRRGGSTSRVIPLTSSPLPLLSSILPSY